MTDLCEEPRPDDAVFFGWDPAARNTCRCLRCECLHVWVENVPNKCTSCGVRFNWPRLQVAK
jgi:hypothetical protein